jgi:hypothetical protein
VSVKSAYDPETIQLLRSVLDDAWNALPPEHQRKIRKSHMAGYVLMHAADGKLHPSKLRFRAIDDAVQALAAA